MIQRSYTYLDPTGFGNNKSRLPFAEYPWYPNKYDSVNIFKFGPFIFTLIDVKLLSEHEIFKNHAFSSLK